MSTAAAMTVIIEGLNLEKLLREAADSGVTLFRAERIDVRAMRVRVQAWQMCALLALCERLGWTAREERAGWIVRALRFARRRAVLFAGLLLAGAVVYLSSLMVLRVEVIGAGEHAAEVRRVLAQADVKPGRLKAKVSTDELREQLALCVPGLSFAGVRYAGSTMVVECHGAHAGEVLTIEGTAMDIVATQPGIVTRVSASSGTPQVAPGDTVRKGQVLIAGAERTQKGETKAVQAQGQVLARVWARGEARVRLQETHSVETGAQRRRVTIKSPWHSRIVQDAQPFVSQDVSVRTQPVVGLYLPLWREIETFAETVVTKSPRDRGDAYAWAQGAAEEIAKKQAPFHALILDKWVDYSIIDNEFLYAVVILEYEDAIAGRIH